MQPERLIRLLPVSLPVTLLSGLVLCLFAGPEWAIGVLVGGLWSTANLWALYHILYEVFFEKRAVVMILWLQLKLPVLYGLGYAAVAFLPMNFIWAIVGFHIPLMVIFAGGFTIRNTVKSPNPLGLHKNED